MRRGGVYPAEVDYGTTVIKTPNVLAQGRGAGLPAERPLERRVRGNGRTGQLIYLDLKAMPISAPTIAPGIMPDTAPPNPATPKNEPMNPPMSIGTR